MFALTDCFVSDVMIPFCFSFCNCRFVVAFAYFVSYEIFSLLPSGLGSHSVHGESACIVYVVHKIGYSPFCY